MGLRIGIDTGGTFTDLVSVDENTGLVFTSKRPSTPKKPVSALISVIKDLQKELIITPLDPDETFSDDPLRMLRAVRFAAKLDFKIAPNIIDSIERMRDRIKIVLVNFSTKPTVYCGNII